MKVTIVDKHLTYNKGVVMTSIVLCFYVCMGRTEAIDCVAVYSHHLAMIIISGMAGAHVKYEFSNAEGAHALQL